MDLFVEEQVVEKEYAEARDKARATVLRTLGEDTDDSFGYDSYEEYGSHNDSGYTPLPELTPETEDGFLGLDPPLN